MSRLANLVGGVLGAAVGRYFARAFSANSLGSGRKCSKFVKSAAGTEYLMYRNSWSTPDILLVLVPQAIINTAIAR